MKKLVFLTAACTVAIVAEAEVRLAPVFGDKMVLQREMPVRVWGFADPRETVTVRFADQKKTVIAEDDGTWRLELDPMPASREGRTLTVTGCKPDGGSWSNGYGLWASKNATNEQKIEDVLVGEVWFCSGQSNTSCPIWGKSPRFRDGQGAMVLQMTKRPLVRLVKMPNVWKTEPNLGLQATWMEMDPQLFADFQRGLSLPSAMGYYFALELYGALEIPVGLMDSSWGGTNIDAWTPPSGLASRPDLKDVAELPLLEADAFKKAREKGGVYCGKGIYGGPQQQPSVLWNGMVATFAPMAIRGFIWYQGCHNASEYQRYCSKMHALYNGWAKEFENPDLKLYFVQLAPWGYPGIANIQEAQAQFDAEQPNAGMAVINDVGNLSDIHPNDKRTVAKRLAVHALKRDYGFTSIRDNSPTLKGWKIDGNKFRLTFNDAESWYIYNPDRSVQTGFEIAGEDGKFVPAKIENLVWGKGRDGKPKCDGNINGAELVVSADGVAAPKKLRYLYSRPWFGCVYNESALPLGAFHIGE